MGPLKSVFGVIGSVVSVAYCGYLIYYFLDQVGSLQQAQEMGLSPTLLGLAVVGGFFFIVLAIKLVLIFGAFRSRKSRGGPDTPPQDGGFDADAVVARYMAQHPVGDAPGTPPAPPTSRGGGSAKRTSFGRRTQ